MRGESGSWIATELRYPRSSSQTADIWKEIEQLSRDPSKDTVRKKRIQETGIARSPVLSQLAMDFVHSVPYDPIHLCLSGWGKLLMSLFWGHDHRNQCFNSPYVLKSDKKLPVSQSWVMELEVSLPVAGDRRCKSNIYLFTKRKEDFKAFGIFYGKVLFHGIGGMGRKAKLLCSLTSKMLQIVFNPTPDRNEWRNLRVIVERAHAVFTELVYVDPLHAFCFAPTTHAILHLPTMLLLNASQFVIERLVGEVGARVKSHLHPEASLFHNNNTLFAIRLLNGGVDGPFLVSEPDECNPGQEGQQKCTVRGAGEKITPGTTRAADATAFLKILYLEMRQNCDCLK